jgi:outer membrane protein assembly factor BamB
MRMKRIFVALIFTFTLTAADWPQFRGPRRDGISDERGLLQAWPDGSPKRLWTTTNLGRGYSSPIIAGNRVYITGDVGSELHVFCLDLSGKPIWTATNGFAWKNEYPGARASVTYNDGRIYHENAHGVIACLDPETGREHWTVDLLKAFKGQNITWGLSECLLVDERAVYATAGGRNALMVALDKSIGKLIWKSQPLGEDSASYVSPIQVNLGAQRLLVGCSLRNLYCIDANSGKILSSRPFPTAYSVLAMTPTHVNGSVFMTAPHGKGGFLLRLPGLEEIWQTPLDTCQGGAVHANGKLFASFYQPRKGWAALDAKTGKILYQDPDFAKGAGVFAENRLYALSEDGWMRLLEPTDAQFKEHGKFRVTDARVNDAWAHPVVHGRRLYLRYDENLFCYDLKP